MCVQMKVELEMNALICECFAYTYFLNFFRTVNCPVGYYWMGETDTCYHMSAVSKDYVVNSVKEAETICQSHGARLWQPRAEGSILHLEKARLVYFKKTANFPGYLIDVPDSVAAIGLW